MSIQEVKPDLGVERQRIRRRRRSLGKRLGAFAVAAGIGLVGCSGSGAFPTLSEL